MKARSFIALLLCALLLGGVLPASAFASEDPQKTEADNVLSESSAGENSDVLPIKEEDEPQEVRIEPTVEESMMLENDAEETETAEPKAAGPETAEPDTEAQEKAEPGQETVGFSLYTVEFTYNSLQYVLPGDSSAAMSEILSEVGLSGEVSAVEISDTNLFSASNETGKWVVTAHQAFSTTEWMKVTIGGIVYEIQVTDDDPIDNPEMGYTLTLNKNYDGAISGSYTGVTTMTLPASTRSGYFFQGWAESATGSVVYKAGETITLTSDKTLYAAWLYSPLIGNIPASSGGYVYIDGIRWCVIGVSDSKWLLISANVLGGDKTWNDAKNYCGTVYDGFSPLEQNAVLNTTKTDDAAYDIYAASNLSDAKLFLLSASEAVTYFSSDDDRQPGWWWLRSLHYDGDNRAGAVLGGGSLSYGDVDDGVSFGARPAFQLNLESVLFESAAEGGKSSAAAGSGNFGEFKASSENGRKLTLLDSSRSAFDASTANTTVAPGGTLAVTYSGAGTATNEYVSAMICNTGGETLYYASLTSAGSGTWNMTIPSGLAEGSYTLKVFSEQQNGDNNTDYAGAPVEIGITVSGSPVTTYTVTVNVNDESMGTASADPSSGAADTEVTLTATPNQGYRFKEWKVTSGGVTITDNKFTIGTADVVVQAVFEAIPAATYNVTVSVNDESMGTASADPTSGAAGTEVTLTATPNQGYRFKEWNVISGGVTIADYKFTIGTADVAVQAVFEEISAATYNVTVEGGTAEKTTAAAGETVTITADAPEDGMCWVQWGSADDVEFAQADAATTTFTMPDHDVSVSAVYASIVLTQPEDQVYTGYSRWPDIGVSLDGVDIVLTRGVDYYVTYANNVNVGTATATVTFMGHWAGSKSTTFAITPCSIRDPKVGYGVADQTYDGTEHAPVVTITRQGDVLEEGKDYILDYPNPSGDLVHAGTVFFKITGIGNFKDYGYRYFHINPRPVTITVNDASKLQGGVDPVFSGTVEGLIDENDLGEISYSRTNTDETAGVYEGVLTAAYTANPDYEVSVEKGDFTIKPLIVVWLDGDGSVLQAKTYGEGDEPPAYDGKTPTKAVTAQYTYTFTGWDNGTVDDTTTTYKPLFSETVNKYMVTFVDYDGKTVLKEAVSYDYGTAAAEITLPDDPKREDDAQYTYTFTGWTPEITDVTADAVYTAVYSSDKQSYTITWLQDDGIQIDQTTVEYAETPAHADPTKAADKEYTYTFSGWDPEVTEVTGDATYKATYTKEPIPAKKGILTFDLAGGTLDGKTGKITIEANVGDTIKLPGAPAREGYTFQYWKGSKYEAGAEYKVEGDHTFTAVWEENKAKTYIVTFDANGHGTAPASQTVEEGKKATKPKDPTASGYTFGGWYTDKECKSAYSFDTAVTKDITLYAKWTKSGSSSGGNNGSSSATSGKTAAKTGDNSQIGFWLMLMAASLTGLVVTAMRRRKFRR